MTKVLVTGASGFIAKHIIRELLEQGYEVRGTVRSDTRKAEIDALYPDAAIEYAMLDLTADDGWAEAMAGVDVLMHTASPFPLADPKDPQELIGPAVDGTLRALRAAQAAGITRVILTSSCVAIYKEAGKAPEARSTRDNWTDPNADYVSAYEASKTLAEKAAWDFVAEHPEMELTTVNPGVVLGPAMDTNYGASLELAEQFLDGSLPMLPEMNMPVVDVRDVARMHVGAIAAPESVGFRFPANAGALSMIEIAEAAAAAHPDRKISTRKAPNLLVRMMGLFVPTMKQVSRNLGRNLDVDGSDAEKAFDFTYIPSRDAVVASTTFLADNGV
ncbi:MAG: NAD-dependent epimerase/dehydratase family protein [Actinomycetota bacterium]